MRRRLALISAVALVLAACDKDEAMPPRQPDTPPRTPPPPRASSGIGSDPDNPSGAPGSSRIGTSPNRF